MFSAVGKPGSQCHIWAEHISWAGQYRLYLVSYCSPLTSHSRSATPPPTADSCSCSCWSNTGMQTDKFRVAAN
ncbi:hypothetical protein J6590_017753 [Homalodisca vitripennis]|nr:hypothetical protein J6590_017753 [Homalodisca vitripennis]